MAFFGSLKVHVTNLPLVFLVLGLIIGAVLVEYTNWRWVFWFVGLVALPVAVTCVFLVPPQRAFVSMPGSQAAKFKSLDLVGVSLLTGEWRFYFLFAFI